MPINSTRGAGSAKAFGLTGASGPAFIEATGGTVLTCGDFKTHIFTGNGCFVVSSAGKPSGSNTIEYLVVGGGGGGGARHGGGGGAGGYRQNYPSPASGGLAITKTTYPITIGGGGAGGFGPYNDPVGPRKSIPGTASSIGSLLISARGGAGPNYGSPSVGNPEIPVGYYDGGSGGGSALNSNRGEGNTPPTSPPQGNPGGPPLNTGGSGGGGAGAIGNTPGNNSAGAPGGVGSPIATTFFGPTAPSYGTPGPAPGRYFAGGGGGGGYDNSGGTGGSGGGGPGVTGGSATGTAGTTNTGGGAGGSGGNVPACGTGGAGGSGFVAIRYKFQ